MGIRIDEKRIQEFENPYIDPDYENNPTPEYYDIGYGEVDLIPPLEPSDTRANVVDPEFLESTDDDWSIFGDQTIWSEEFVESAQKVMQFGLPFIGGWGTKKYGGKLASSLWNKFKTGTKPVKSGPSPRVGITEGGVKWIDTRVAPPSGSYPSGYTQPKYYNPPVPSVSPLSEISMAVEGYTKEFIKSLPKNIFEGLTNKAGKLTAKGMQTLKNSKQYQTYISNKIVKEWRMDADDWLKVKGLINESRTGLPTKYNVTAQPGGASYGDTRSWFQYGLEGSPPLKSELASKYPWISREIFPKHIPKVDEVTEALISIGKSNPKEFSKIMKNPNIVDDIFDMVKEVDEFGRSKTKGNLLIDASGRSIK